MTTINLEQLRTICLTDIATLIPNNEKFFFKDNGSNILAIAHCDFVGKDPDFATYQYKGDQFIMSETLDDRLGVYLITQFLPRMGINVDVLLTIDEEKGQSTGNLFKPTKEYNWMFEFDRRGTDIVAYAYKDADLDAKVKEAVGQSLSFGSCSDISRMEDLGIKGINFGCGYHGEHSVGCFATTREIEIGYNNFLNFYNAYKDIKLPHTRIVAAPIVPYIRDGFYTYLEDNTDKFDFGEQIKKRTGQWWKRCEFCDSSKEVKYNESLKKYMCSDCISLILTVEKPTTLEDECDNCRCQSTEIQTFELHKEEFYFCPECNKRFEKLRKHNPIALNYVIGKLRKRIDQEWGA